MFVFVPHEGAEHALPEAPKRFPATGKPRWLFWGSAHLWVCGGWGVYCGHSWHLPKLLGYVGPNLQAGCGGARWGAGSLGLL